MDATMRELLWRQFGAAIDMLENAVNACPDARWGDRSREPEFWYVVFHVLFWLDHYLEDHAEGFRPPEPFGLEEMDPAGVLPPRVYSKAELLAYLEALREKSRLHVASLDDARAMEPGTFYAMKGPRLERLLYNLRHVQHHTGQLQLLLRQHGVEPPRWVRTAARPLTGA